MRYFLVAMAVGAAALAGATTANAAGKGGAKPGAHQSTDISAQHRHHRGHGHMYRHHGRHHGYYRPHYRNYGAYPRHHGYYGGGPYGYYGGGGPGVTFSFGGSRW